MALNSLKAQPNNQSSITGGLPQNAVLCHTKDILFGRSAKDIVDVF